MDKDRPPNGPAKRTLRARLKRLFLREPATNEQLIELLHAAHRNNLFDAELLAMLEGVLHVDDMQVRDIMIPRTQVVMLERDESPEALLRTVVESGHSRFPVLGDGHDEVVGILLAKDLLFYSFERTDSRLNVRSLLRPAIYVPESKRLNVLLREFRSSRNHIAIVIDEYGTIAGMVTIEDVLEQIVGEIEDEHDVEEEDTIRKHSDFHYTIKALTPLEDFNEYFKTSLPDEEVDTIGGLVVNQIGRLPERGERVVIDNLLFKVLRADSRRVHMLQLTMLPRAAGTEETLPQNES